METKPFTGHAGEILPELMTASGHMVDLLNPCPESFSLADIAFSLANEGRWANQCRPWYSVAQHCIRVADRLCGRAGNKPLAAAGLMHDAHEFLLRDIGTPFKLVISGYVLYATRMQNAINERFGLSPSVDEFEAVARADRAETRNEAIQLMPRAWVLSHTSFSGLPDSEDIRPMTRDEAHDCFLERARRYGVQ